MNLQATSCKLWSIANIWYVGLKLKMTCKDSCILQLLKECQILIEGLLICGTTLIAPSLQRRSESIYSSGSLVTLQLRLIARPNKSVLVWTKNWHYTVKIMKQPCCSMHCHYLSFNCGPHLHSLVSGLLRQDSNFSPEACWDTSF